jgi:hypothetical protein
MHRLVGMARIARTHEVGTGHRQSEEQNASGPQEQQEQILKAEDTAAATDGVPQKIHGRPLNHPIPLPVQEMDNDRSRHQRQAPEKPWREKPI